jgi:ribosomal protein S11
MYYLGITKNAVTGKQVVMVYVGTDPVAAQTAAAAHAAILNSMGQNMTAVVVTAPVYVP